MAETRRNSTLAVADVEGNFVRLLLADIPPQPPRAARIRTLNSGLSADAA